MNGHGELEHPRPSIVLLLSITCVILVSIPPVTAHYEIHDHHANVVDYDANSVDTIASYKYITRNCTAGTIVGAVSASGATSYTITNGASGFAVSSIGLISLSSAVPAGRYLLSVQASNFFGQFSTVLVKVTINCNSLSGSSASGSSTGVTINSTCLYDNCRFNYAAPVFSQSPYIFYPTTCGYNATMGSVSATGITTTNTAYWIESGPWVNYFFINPTTGTIQQLAPLPLGTLVTLTVTAWNPNGVPTNVIVTINTTNCVYPSTVSSVTTTAAPTTVGTTTIVYSPYFPFTSYLFTLTTCNSGTTVGSVVASNAVNYYISSGSTNLFSINSAGVISTLSTPTSGIYNLIVTALSNRGLAVSVPVTITVVCAVTTTTTTTVPTTTTTTTTTTTVAPNNVQACVTLQGAPPAGCSYNGKGSIVPLTCGIICPCAVFDPNCNGAVTTNIEACMVAQGSPNLGCSYSGTGTITPLTCPFLCA